MKYIAIAIIALFTFTLPLLAAPQATCPVMGNPINKDAFVDHNGQRIYFCCPGCDKKFLADPDKYLAEMKKAGVELESVSKPQTNCPIMGGKINQEVFVDYNGQRIYFCCAGCPEQFNKAPETYLKKMAAAGITPEKLPAAEKKMEKQEMKEMDHSKMEDHSGHNH